MSEALAFTFITLLFICAGSDDYKLRGYVYKGNFLEQCRIACGMAKSASPSEGARRSKHSLKNPDV